MATYTKETALYDTGAIADDISEAGQTASKYITSVGNDGIKVHPYNTSTSAVDPYNYTLIDADGMEVFKQNDSTNPNAAMSVAEFGEVSRIGMENGTSKMVISRTGIVGSNPDGAPFFNVDYEGATVTATIEVGDSAWGRSTVGTAYTNTVDVSAFSLFSSFYNRDNYNVLIYIPVSSISAVTISNAQNCSLSSWIVRTTGLNFESCPAINITKHVFTVGTSSTYTASCNISGKDINNTNFSYAFSASLAYNASTQKVTETIQVTGSPSKEFDSLINMCGDVTTKAPAFTMGSRTGDSGAYSTVLGEGLSAEEDYQVAIGSYNATGTTNDNFLFMVGNGSPSSRSNAFSVSRGGGIRFDTNDAEDGDIYNALRSLGWDSEVLS